MESDPIEINFVIPAGHFSLGEGNLASMESDPIETIEKLNRGGLIMNEDLETLKKQRSILIERLDAIKRDYRKGLDADSEERAVQLENAEVLEGIAKASQQELDRINAEIEKLS